MYAIPSYFPVQTRDWYSGWNEDAWLHSVCRQNKCTCTCMYIYTQMEILVSSHLPQNCMQLGSHYPSLHVQYTSKKIPINGPFNGVPFNENGARAAQVQGVNSWTGARCSVQFPVPVLPPVSIIIVRPRAHFSPRERASMDGRQCLHTERRPLLS